MVVRHPRAPMGLPVAFLLSLGLGLALILDPTAALAYVGPGAGFAFAGSFFVVFLLILIAPLMVLYSVARFAWQLVRGRRVYKDAQVDRVVVVGLDGLEPTLTKALLDKGELPNLARLAEMGGYRKLASTYPSISPVAWSSFQTGSNPGRHNIYDFLSRDPKTYLPDLSSARISDPSRTLQLGPYKVPLSKPSIRLLRKSKPFWTILGEQGIFGTVLRVPITFPPEPFYGTSLSAMCVPDLRGTQGTFTFFSPEPPPPAEGRAASYGSLTEGMWVKLDRDTDGALVGHIPGPVNTMSEEREELSLPLRLTPREGYAELRVGKGPPLRLEVGAYTPWVKLVFRPGLGIKVNGICRFMLTSLDPTVRLYMTPINVDPGRPAIPISHPFFYSMYLSKLIGPYATLGLAEDTWALSEGIIDDGAFLEQAWSIHEEREEQFFAALEKTRRGLCVCVFDTPDRIQHMFWRKLEPEHPANHGQGPGVHASAIHDMYRRMDDLVGRVMEQIGDDPRTALIVMSDHGFKSFQRGIHLNGWLKREGYLALKDGEEPGDWYRGVDWSRTKAYAFGLGGIYLNLAGREGQGIVEPGEEAEALKDELVGKLRGLRDPDRDALAIVDVYKREDIYEGPYVRNAPDLLAGFAPGYRVSWESVTGTVTDEVFADNVKAWSGDHCINPPDVPGVLFANFPLPEEASIIDIAPTVLHLFGVDTPDHMDGRSLVRVETPARPAGGVS